MSTLLWLGMSALIGRGGAGEAGWLRFRAGEYESDLSAGLRVCGVPSERGVGRVLYPERCSGLVYGVPLGHWAELNGARMGVSDDESDLCGPLHQIGDNAHVLAPRRLSGHESGGEVGEARGMRLNGPLGCGGGRAGNNGQGMGRGMGVSGMTPRSQWRLEGPLSGPDEVGLDPIAPRGSAC